MTPNERKTMEAVIALLKPHTPWEELAVHLATLRAALDADRAPRECDPYARTGPTSIAAIFKNEANIQAQQQYDADPPQEPGRETPEAPK